MADAHLPHADHDGANPGVHHEVSDVDVRGILLFGAGLFVMVAVVSLLVWVLFGYVGSREAIRGPREYPLAATEQNRLPPEPRLQTNPREDLRELRVHEEQVLTSYGWVDRNAGVVRIPIDEAMKMVVKKGLAVRRSPDAGR